MSATTSSSLRNSGASHGLLIAKRLSKVDLVGDRHKLIKRQLVRRIVPDVDRRRDRTQFATPDRSYGSPGS